MRVDNYTSDGPITVTAGITFWLDDQGGTQPPKPWKEVDPEPKPEPEKPEDDDKKRNRVSP